MHSLFNEQLVKRSPSMKTRLMQIGIGLTAILVIVILGFFESLTPVIPALLAVIIVAAIIMIRRQNIEFEYTLNESFLDVDKILAKSTRKNIASIELSSVEFFAIVTESKKELKSKYQSVYDCSGDEGDVYGIAYPGVADEGKCILLFTPNEKMLDALQRGISPRIWKYNA